VIKGEIWWANLDEEPYGSEPGKRRPVLVLQNNSINWVYFNASQRFY